MLYIRSNSLKLDAWWPVCNISIVVMGQLAVTVPIGSQNNYMIQRRRMLVCSSMGVNESWLAFI